MDKDNLNISRIENYLNEIIDNVVSNNTFFGSVPEKESIGTDWEDMVVIEIPNGIEDREAFGQGTALIWLYAKPLSSGRKNVRVMDMLETALNEAIRNASSPIYTLSRRSTYTDYNTDINWHCNAVEIIVKAF